MVIFHSYVSLPEGSTFYPKTDSLTGLSPTHQLKVNLAGYPLIKHGLLEHLPLIKSYR